MYMVSSRLLGRGLRLQILDILFASVAGIFRAAASIVASEVPEVGCCFRTYSVCNVTAAISFWHLIGGCPSYQNPGRKTANETLGRPHSSDVTDYKYGNNSQPLTFQKQQLKMPATDVGKTSRICKLGLRSTSLEDTIYKTF